MSKTSEYIKNTAILLAGKFVTQFMSFLLLPLYTHYLLADDYGTVDIIQTYMTLLIPILLLRFDSAVFRFLIDERKNEKGKTEIISNVMIALFFQIIVFIIGCYIIGFFFKNIKYFYLILINVPAIMLSNILLQIARGIGKTKEYSITCIITGLITLVVNVVLIICYHQNASSILISSILANIIASIYLLFVTKVFSYIKLNSVSKNKLFELLKYSLPMIPNSLSWWIINVSDRTIISIILGVAYNRNLYSFFKVFEYIK